MRKNEFLDKLRASLWAMPEADIQRSLDYYSEMIDDRMDDGLSEEEAVAAIGDLDEIVKQILTESPRPPVVMKAAQKQRRVEPWMILLLILGSPLWVPLVTGAVSAVLSVYLSLWSVVAVLYVVAVAVGAAAIGCLIGCFFMIGRFGVILVSIGAALLCAGLAIVLFLLGNLAAKGMIALTKWCWQSCQQLFKGKERKA